MRVTVEIKQLTTDQLIHVYEEAKKDLSPCENEEPESFVIQNYRVKVKAIECEIKERLSVKPKSTEQGFEQLKLKKALTLSIDSSLKNQQQSVVIDTYLVTTDTIKEIEKTLKCRKEEILVNPNMTDFLKKITLENIDAQLELYNQELIRRGQRFNVTITRDGIK